MSKSMLSKYEKAFLSEIIRNNPDWEEYLREQLNSSQVISRGYTGAGCYIDFEVYEKEIDSTKFINIPKFFEANIVAPDESDAAFFLLYTQESKKSRIIHFLEIAVAGTNYNEVDVYSWLNPNNAHNQ